MTSAKLSERDTDDYAFLNDEDFLDAATEHPAVQPAPCKEPSLASKIPVKRKPSKNGAPLGLTKRESLKSSKLISLEWENGHGWKQGGNYTVSPLSSNKDEEIGLDREHFKNLKNFWEKGGESTISEGLSEMARATEANGRTSRLSRSLSVQSDKSQTSDDMFGSNMYPKARVPSPKLANLSSSEDERVYIAPPRKGSGSSIPRSTYGKSKGATVNKNNLSDWNGKQPPVEEEKKAQRCFRRSKLPVRIPSVKIQSPPAKEQCATLFEPEIPADEYIMAEESRQKRDSLVSRVQILIESVPSEDTNTNCDAMEKSSALGSQEEPQQTEEELLEEKSSGSVSDLWQNETAAISQAMDGCMHSGMRNHYWV